MSLETLLWPGVVSTSQAYPFVLLPLIVNELESGFKEGADIKSEDHVCEKLRRASLIDIGNISWKLVFCGGWAGGMSLL